MIQAHELMIGNWVEIIQPKKGIYTTIQPSSFSVNIEKRYKPIPLTEQWLIDFGFIKRGRCFDFLEGSVFNIELIRNHWHVCYTSNSVIATLQYVHELQQLFYALTGKQLNKKP